MTSVCVIDTAFPLEKQTSAGMAVRCVKWQAQRAGLSVSLDPAHSDYILLSSVFPRTAKYGARMRKFGKPIIFGGAGCLQPVAYLDYADFVVVGDGDNVLRALAGGKEIADLENVLVRGKAKVTPNQDFPFDCPPIQQEDGNYAVWCGRGCKNKCYFCLTGWALEYKQAPSSPAPLAKKLLAEGKHISYVSNDLLQHDWAHELPPTNSGSYSVRFLKKFGLPKARQIRLGVEGVSERLRAFVNKPITTDDLIGCTSWLNANKKSVRWFLIAGLPTETWADWEDLQRAVFRWKEIAPHGVLELSFTAYCPTPGTPLAVFGLTKEYYNYFETFKRFFFDGLGFSNRIKLWAPMAPTSQADKISAMAWQANEKLVKYPYLSQALKIRAKLETEFTGERAEKI